MTPCLRHRRSSLQRQPGAMALIRQHGDGQGGEADVMSNRYAVFGLTGLGLAKITLQFDLASQGSPLISHALVGLL